MTNFHPLVKYMTHLYFYHYYVEWNKNLPHFDRCISWSSSYKHNYDWGKRKWDKWQILWCIQAWHPIWHYLFSAIQWLVVSYDHPISGLRLFWWNPQPKHCLTSTFSYPFFVLGHGPLMYSLDPPGPKNHLTSKPIKWNGIMENFFDFFSYSKPIGSCQKLSPTKSPSKMHSMLTLSRVGFFFKSWEILSIWLGIGIFF